MSDITAAVTNVVDEQSFLFRRKDTITMIAGLILQVAQITYTQAEGAPVWVTVLIAATIGACQALLTALTKAPVTPSMADRLEQAAPTTTGGTLDTIRRAAEA